MSTPAGQMAGTVAESLFRHEGQAAACYQVVRLPRLPRLRMLTQLTSPLVGAYQLGAKVFSSWSHQPYGPFTVHVGGTHGFPTWVEDTAADTGGLVFPPGAAGLRRGTAAEMLGPRLLTVPCWQRLGAMVAPGEAGPGLDSAADGAVEVLEDHASFLADLAFELLTIAIPVPVDEVRRSRSRLSSALFATEQQLEHGVATLAMGQLRAQLVEHTAAVAAGLWRVHAFVGAADPASARQVAALWCAATAPHGPVPYRLAPVGEVGDLRATAAAAHPGGAGAGGPAGGSGAGAYGFGDGSVRGPFTIGSTMLAALCRPPLQELPGVAARATNPFDVAADDAGQPGTDESPAAGCALPFGEILDAASRPVGTLRVPLRSLGSHTFVHGATGAGKSQATRHLLTELSRRGIPWVVLEPAKSEYATGMQERLDRIRDELPDPTLADVHVIRPGDPSATPVCLPPLHPDPEGHYQAHLDMLIDLAVAAFDAESPFPEVLTQAVELAVRESGWDPALSQTLRSLADRYPDGTGPAFPDVADLVRCCHQVIDSKGYGREVAGNVHGFVDMRLGTLTTGTKRIAFSSGYPLSLSTLLRRNVVLELQDLGTDSDRALFMGLFLARLSQAVRRRHHTDPRDGVLRNVVCVEEAHRLLRNPEALSPAAARAVGSFTDLLAEVRSQGVALLVAEQIPAKLAPDVVKNTAVKCMGRTPAADDRALVGAATGLDEAQSREVVTLSPGTFAVHADGYDQPVLVRFPYYPESGTATPRDPAPLVEPLPPWFGPVAIPGAATQRDLAWAAECAHHPRLVALCELTVVAHLAHYPLPVPDQNLRLMLLTPLREAVSSAPVRAETADVDGGAGSSGAPALDIAIGTLVGQAVKARRSVLGPYSAEDLATIAAAAVRASLATTTIAKHTDAPDPRWRSRPHQWLAIRSALAAREDGEPAHPDTTAWRAWGVTYVAGATIREQRVNLLSAVLHRQDDVAVALHGRHRPGGLERAVGETGLPFEAGLEQILRAFTNSRSLAGLRKALGRHAR